MITAFLFSRLRLLVEAFAEGLAMHRDYARRFPGSDS